MAKLDSMGDALHRILTWVITTSCSTVWGLLAHDLLHSLKNPNLALTKLFSSTLLRLPLVIGLSIALVLGDP